MVLQLQMQEETILIKCLGKGLTKPLPHGIIKKKQKGNKNYDKD